MFCKDATSLSQERTCASLPGGYYEPSAGIPALLLAQGAPPATFLPAVPRSALRGRQPYISSGAPMTCSGSIFSRPSSSKSRSGNTALERANGVALPHPLRLVRPRHLVVHVQLPDHSDSAASPRERQAQKRRKAPAIRHVLLEALAVAVAVA